MAEMNNYPASSRRISDIGKYDAEKVYSDSINLDMAGIPIYIVNPAGSWVPVNKIIAGNKAVPISEPIPFHLGYIQNTAGRCKLVLKPGTYVSDSTTVMLIEYIVSPTTVEHLVVIGYRTLEDISSTILQCLGIDTTRGKVVKHAIDVATLKSWISRDGDDIYLPFKGLVLEHESRHDGIGDCCMPVNYTYRNGRKVYASSIIGSIVEMNPRLRNICDTITFMDDSDVFILYISSGGGDTQTASAILTAIAQCNGTVVTVATGPCASAAPVVWSHGHIRLMTDSSSMMVHSIATTDPSTKTVSHLVDAGYFTTKMSTVFLKSTVGRVGLATDEEIGIITSTSKEYYHSAEETHRRTNAPIVNSDKDIWKYIELGKEDDLWKFQGEHDV